ncbi:MAG: FprA family A-type flavoprotein, partial [Thermoplasmata archaeon]|nr:FprA family A-type flavoprotein [Thermoplasmata archaeon]
KAVAVYASMYGAVRKAVRRALEKFSSLGFEVLEFPFTDSSWASIADAIGEMEDSPIVVVGAPTYEAGTFPLMDMVVNLIVEKIGREKRILIVSSFGWGGVAGKKAAERLKDFSAVRVVEFKGFPSPQDLEEIDRAAEELAGGL